MSPELGLSLPLPPHYAAQLLVRVLGGKGSGNFGHAGRKGEVGGSGEGSAVDAHAERAQQEQLAAAQTDPLAHPEFIMGLHNVRTEDATRYVAAYGQRFASAGRPADVPKDQDKECYKNASMLVMSHPELDYAEGFGQVRGLGDLTFAHAWAVDKAGNVIDSTWDHSESNKYFGVRYAREPYLKYLLKAKIYGVLAGDRKSAQRAIETGVPELRGVK